MQIIKVSHVNGDEKNIGCKEAPNEVSDLLKSILSNEKGDVIIHEKINYYDIPLDSENPLEADHIIYNESLEIFDRNFFSIFIGGDHSISYPILKAFHKKEANPLILVFDAHLNCRENRCKIPNNREWLRKLIEEGFNPSGVIFISSRNMEKEEMDFIKENQILLIKMDLLREDIEGICDLIMERARSSSGFYMSIDIDSIDPGFAPGTFLAEPGGISSSDIIYFIKRLKLLKNFKGVEVVEINPDLDINKLTVKLGAKLVGELL